MRISKGLVVGLVAALLAGAAQAAGEQAVENLSGTEENRVSITVPPGNVGDRVAYAFFNRSQETDPWTTQSNWSWRVDSVGRVPDRFGALHEAVHVVSDNWTMHGEKGIDAGPLGQESSRDREGYWHGAFYLSNRTVLLYQIREEWVDHTFLTSRDAEQEVAFYGPFKTQGIFPGDAEPKFVEAFHQGLTYSVETDLRGWAANLIASYVWFPEILGGARGVNLEFSAQVGDAVLLDETIALPLLVSGCIDWVSADFSGRIHFFGRALTSFPAAVCFEYTEWVTASSAYPVRMQMVTHINGAARGETVAELVGFVQGEETIPWGAGERPVPPPPIKFSPASQRHPSDGELALPYPLSEALQAISNDPTLVQFQLWKSQHTDSIVAGGSLTAARTGSSRAQWEITFGAPAGRAFVVSTSRDASGGPITSTEIGEFPIRAFRPDELPAAPITLGTAADLWNRYSLKDPKVNNIAWGFAYAGPYVYCPTTQSCKPVEGKVGASVNPHGLFFGQWKSSNDNHIYGPWVDQRYEVILIDVRTGEVPIVGLYGNAFQSPSVPVAMEKRDAPLSPHAVPKTPTSIDLAAGALLSTSLIVLILAAYFFPALKFLGAQVGMAIPGYAKTEKGQVLNHKVRETLANAIRSDPGITPPQLHALVGGSWMTVVYHLRQLEKNKIVSSLLDGRHKRFFPTETVNWSDRDRISALRNHRTKELYHLLLDEPGMARDDVARKLGISRPATYWHIERLERTGLVGRDRDGRRTRFFAYEVGKPANPKEAVEVA